MRQTVVEGCREVTHALAAGVAPTRVFVCQELLDANCNNAMQLCIELDEQQKTELITVTQDVYKKIAYRESSGGLLVVIPYVDRPLKTVPVDETALILVVESPEKPGNLGALLRTADAAGFNAVVVCGEGTDVHNPNVVRASLGALFTMPVSHCTTSEGIDWLSNNDINSIAATPYANTVYGDVNMTGKTAIVVGSEAFGLSEEWLAAADERVRIPMHGKVDSLNLSASAAILMYEAVRQRSL